MKFLVLLLTSSIFLKTLKARKEVAVFDGEGFVPDLIAAFESDLHAEGEFGIQYPCRLTGDLEEGCELKVSHHDKWEYICCNGVCDRKSKRFAAVECPRAPVPGGASTTCYFCTHHNKDDMPGWCVTSPESHTEAQMQCTGRYPYCAVSYFNSTATPGTKGIFYRGCGTYPRSCSTVGNIDTCHCNTDLCNNRNCQNQTYPWTPVECDKNRFFCYHCQAYHKFPNSFDCKDKPIHLKLCGNGQVCRTLSYVSTIKKGSVIKRECVRTDREPGQCYRTATRLPQDASPTNPSCECICDQSSCNKEVYFGAGWNACASKL